MAQLRYFLSHSSTDRDFADALNSLQHYSEALAAFEQALALDPTNAVIWRNKAGILNDMKRYTEALQAAEQALTLEPQSAIGWQRKAALRGLGRTKEAEEAEARAKALGG